MSKQRAKGTAWSTKIERYLADEGFTVQRQALYGANDRGDLHVGDDVVVEAKNQSRHSLGEWLDEANVEAGNAGRSIGVAWFHRRGKSSPADGYVLLDGRTFALLLREAGVA